MVHILLSLLISYNVELVAYHIIFVCILNQETCDIAVACLIMNHFISICNIQMLYEQVSITYSQLVHCTILLPLLISYNYELVKWSGEVISVTQLIHTSVIPVYKTLSRETTCLQRPLFQFPKWGFPLYSTCLQWPPVYSDHFCLVQRVVFVDRFHPTPAFNWFSYL